MTRRNWLSLALAAVCVPFALCWNKVKPVTANRSYLELLDDGGVLLGDGYGSEIRMTGGSIHITCPGDIWLQSGKNILPYGG